MRKSRYRSSLLLASGSLVYARVDDADAFAPLLRFALDKQLRNRFPAKRTRLDPGSPAAGGWRTLSKAFESFLALTVI
jgi:hypothetical protein